MLLDLKGEKGHEDNNWPARAHTMTSWKTSKSVLVGNTQNASLS